MSAIGSEVSLSAREVGESAWTPVVSSGSVGALGAGVLVFVCVPGEVMVLDDVAILSDGISSHYAYSYNGANELVSMTGPNGTVTYAYDGLGRLTSRSLGGFVASYEYHHGELLTAVTTNFPGEASFSLEYDGLGRLRQVEAAGEDPLGFNYAGGAWANSTEDHTGARERSWNGGEGLSIGHPATGDHFYIAADHLPPSPCGLRRDGRGTARGYYDGSKTRVSPLRRMMGKACNHHSRGTAHAAMLPGRLPKGRCFGVCP